MHPSNSSNVNVSALPKIKVISVGILPELLALREAVLETAGFQVFTTSSEKHALLRIENSGCAVLLLCYALDDETRERLIKKFREKCPTGRIVALANSPMSQPPAEADAFVYGVEGAEALIEAVSGKNPIR
jgi:PleD family two-component response regulator